ncbi:MAG TPA: hypothetical protein VE397_16110, partial [Stellaceae bacterium]|nr:hypothetical protein [Stellaceae bacterium]
AFVNPVFDPRHSRLFPETNFWLDVKAGSQTIATTAERLFVTDDVLDLLRSMRPWLAEPPAEYGQLAVSLPPGSPEIGGIVGHEGGVWVHPQHRKRGLSVILPHLSTALARREWDIDWQTGIVRGTLGDCGMATWAYGFAHVEPCFEGYFPLTRSDDRSYFCYMNREELTAGLNLDVVARLLPDRHQQPRHASALVEKR